MCTDTITWSTTVKLNTHICHCTISCFVPFILYCPPLCVCLPLERFAIFLSNFLCSWARLAGSKLVCVECLSLLFCCLACFLAESEHPCTSGILCSIQNLQLQNWHLRPIRFTIFLHLEKPQVESDNFISASMASRSSGVSVLCPLAVGFFLAVCLGFDFGSLQVAPSDLACWPFLSCPFESPAAIECCFSHSMRWTSRSMVGTVFPLEQHVSVIMQECSDQWII